MSEKRYCSNCNAELDDDSIFCTQCGDKVVQNEEVIKESSIKKSEPKFSDGKKLGIKQKLKNIDKIKTIFFSLLIILFVFVFLGLHNTDNNMSNIDTTNNDNSVEEDTPSVSIYSNVKKGEYPLEVSCSYELEGFTENETDLFFYWDFGDGFVTVVQNATHIYEKIGTYTISLIVSYESYIGSSGLSDCNGFVSNEIEIKVKHRDFQLSGKIINNYYESMDVDYAVVDNWNSWSYWAPTVYIQPYEEKEFSCEVEGDVEEYLIWAQWFYPDTNTYGCEISTFEFTNPKDEDLTYYIEIKTDGEIEISENYNPP